MFNYVSIHFFGTDQLQETNVDDLPMADGDDANSDISEGDYITSFHGLSDPVTIWLFAVCPHRNNPDRRG